MKITLKKIGDVAIPSTEADREMWQRFSDAEYEVDMKNLDSRTSAQNRALHLWCDKIANTLNKNNLYMTGLFQNDIEWTMDLVKTQIIKSVISKTLGINSTTKMKRKDIDQLVDYITLVFGQSFGIQIPDFPSRELFNEQPKEKK